MLYIAFGLLTIVGIATIMTQARNSQGGTGISFARATRFSDFEGNVCGEDSFADRPLAFFPVLPGTTFNGTFSSAINFRICVSDCKKTFSRTQDEVEGPNVFLVEYFASIPFLRDIAGYPTRPIADRLCVPDLRGLTAIIPDALEEAGERQIEELQKGFSELLTIINTDVLGVLESWEIFPISIAIAMLVFLLYMAFLAIFGGFMIWATAIIVGALIFALPAYVLLNVELKAGPLQLDGFDETISGENREYWSYAAYGMIGVGVIYVGLLMYLRKRIAAAISILKYSTRAIMGIPTLLIFPLLWLASVISYLVLWVIGYLVLDQMRSEPESFEVPNSVNVGDTEYRLFEASEADQVARNIHIFGLIWNIQFLYYFAYYVVAGTISTWYFSRDKSKVPGGTLATQIWRAIRYHMGTIAFGSLLMAIVKVIRYIVRTAEKRSKAKSNKITRAVFSCVTCCLYCVEALIDRISKNGLVYTAIFGYPLWTAGMKATGMMAQNLARAAAVGVIGKYSIFIGKLFVTFGTGFAAIGFFDRFPEYSGENEILTLTVSMIVAYIVSLACFNVFDVAVDTVFLCFIYDESMVKMHGQMYASGELKALIGGQTDYEDLYDPETGLVYDLHDMTYRKSGAAGGGRGSTSMSGKTQVSYKTNSRDHIAVEMDGMSGRMPTMSIGSSSMSGDSAD